jgi:hypothetical protein
VLVSDEGLLADSMAEEEKQEEAGGSEHALF